MQRNEMNTPELEISAPTEVGSSPPLHRRRNFLTIDWFLRILLIGLLSLLAWVLLSHFTLWAHVTRLRMLGADVTYGGKGGGFVRIPSDLPVPNFLQAGSTSLDYLSRHQPHTNLNFDNTNVSDSDLGYLKRVRGPLYIELKNTSISDIGLSQLTDMVNLFVSPLDSQLTEIGIRNFTSARELRRLTTLHSEIPNETDFSQIPSQVSLPEASPPILVAPFSPEQAVSGQHAWANHLKTQSEIKNFLGMKLRLIPPGEFRMGSPESPEQSAPLSRKTGEQNSKLKRFADEHPQHRRRISKAFFLSTDEVTRGQFRKFIEDSDYKPVVEWDSRNGGWGFDGSGIRERNEFNWRETGFEQTDEHPVANVSWTDATKFCEWLSRKEHRRYRLPSETEWEYACRAGTEGQFQCGDDPEELAKIANVPDADLRSRIEVPESIKTHDGFVFTAPVGSFPPNSFGLHDMHGNVFEWCQDWYSPTSYSHPSIPAEPQSSGYRRVNRGGSWLYSPSHCRSASRDYGHDRLYYSSLGFRVARDLDIRDEKKSIAPEG